MARQKKGAQPQDAAASSAPADAGAKRNGKTTGKAATTKATATAKKPAAKKGKGAGKNGGKRKRGEPRTKVATDKAAIALAERRKEALDYRRQGYTFAQIAEAMEISTTTAWSYVTEEIKAIPQEEADEVRKMELDRLDVMQQQLFPLLFEAPDSGIIDGILRIMDRRARYLGLYRDDSSPTDKVFKAMGERMAQMMKQDAPVLHIEAGTPVPANPVL